MADKMLTEAEEYSQDYDKLPEEQDVAKHFV